MTAMTHPSAQDLDNDELIHLAIEASGNQRHGDAIEYLKQALSKSRKNFKALYLLAAEHAQIGLTERSIEEFKEALELQPDLAPARFQLGLLFLCNGRVPEALGTLERLDRLQESDPYLHFKRGLEGLCQDDFAACQENLKRGMQLNTTNPALNADMQKILDRVSAHLGGAGGPGAGADRPQSGEQPGQILLSAYTKSIN